MSKLTYSIFKVNLLHFHAQGKKSYLFIKGRYEVMGEKQARRRYSKRFKAEAVEQVLRSNKIAVEIAGDLGIRAGLLYR